MKARTDTWLAVLLLVSLLVGAYFLASPGPRAECKASTTYNADPRGVKAFYVLLGERLGYTVSRLLKPYTRIPRDARVLIVVQPRQVLALGMPEAFGSREARALAKWVEKGGVVIFASDGLVNVPEPFRRNRPLGKGAVYAFDSRKIITNEGMRDHRNAVRLLDIITRHAGKRDLILFDEYHHGIREDNSVWAAMGRQVKIALGMLAAAAIILAYGQGRRFGAVRSLPESRTRRTGAEFVESVGRLYARAGATELAAEVLSDSFRRSLCTKLGLAPESSRDRIAGALRLTSGDHIAERVRALLESAEAGQKPTQQELLDVARQIVGLENEIGIGGMDG